MGYMHIDNLYKDQTVLMFKECYALEKIHGTNAHISWNGEDVKFYAGGADHWVFKGLFKDMDLKQKFTDAGYPALTVYGEAYGGKLRGMRHMYGNALRFVAFDVKIGESWLAVPNALEVVTRLGLEFVAFERVPATKDALDAERDRPSRQAIRNGCGDNHVGEGIVIRPLIEWYRGRAGNASRVIAKHKTAAFSERASKKDTMIDDPERTKLLADADAIVLEWVTPMRLAHVVDKIRADKMRPLFAEDTRDVISGMVEDVRREASGEILESKAMMRAVSSATAKMFIASLQGNTQ